MSGRISFEFATNSASGVLLYNGPFSDAEPQNDYIAVYLQGGEPRARINLGGGEVLLQVTGRTLNDGNWHSLEIIKQNQVRRTHLSLPSLPSI